MISRRGVLGGLAGLATPALSACASRQMAAPEVVHPGAPGLDCVIDISYGVQVYDFKAIRRSNILAIIHKATEGGDWVDPAYGVRQVQAEAAGLLWGAYHFGTRQYSGADQANAFLAVVKPTPSTVIALDLEPNEPNPRNTMTYAQAEAFVTVIQQKTGRYPLLYTHSQWAEGQKYGRRGMTLGQPIQSGSMLSRCDLWLADYREEPAVPSAWAGRGWKLWQYAGNQTENDVAYGAPSRAVKGVTHCDRNYFNGDVNQFYRFWNARPR